MGARQRVLRGGSWNDDGRNCRSANRNANEPDERNDDIGFRLARALAECDAQQAQGRGQPRGGGCRRGQSVAAPAR